MTETEPYDGRRVRPPREIPLPTYEQLHSQFLDPEKLNLRIKVHLGTQDGVEMIAGNISSTLGVLCSQGAITQQQAVDLFLETQNATNAILVEKNNPFGSMLSFTLDADGKTLIPLEPPSNTGNQG